MSSEMNIQPCNVFLFFPDKDAFWRQNRQGFTLIEMSIVLVIIALVLGTILVGKDLIGAAEARAQVSQIQKYNAAVNTFRNKYGGLPGDLPNPLASMFGFVPRGTNIGQGDGDGLITSHNSGSIALGSIEGVGETTVFWVDLSSAGLIDTTLNTASETTFPTGFVTLSIANNIASYFPQAKLGRGNIVYVYNGNCLPVTSGGCIGYVQNYMAYSDPYNWFGIGIMQVGSSTGTMQSNAVFSGYYGVPVDSAAAMDKKIDDGMPLTGSVITVGLNGVPAVYINATDGWTYWGGPPGITGVNQTDQTAPDKTSCISNGAIGNASGTERYAVATAGSNPNCFLSFRMQ